MLYDQPQKDMDWCGQKMTSTLFQRTTLDIYPIQRSRSCYKTATKTDGTDIFLAMIASAPS